MSETELFISRDEGGTARRNGFCGAGFTIGLLKWQGHASDWEETLDSAGRKGMADRSKINMHQPHEVKYRAKELDVSPEDLQRAVEKVGNSAAAVRKQLSSVGSANGT